MKKRPRCYWDSSCFIAWLKPEPERRSKCQEVLRAAERGEIQIVTSAISLVEVIKLDKGPLQITQEKEKKIRNFFLHEYIVVVQLTRKLGESARSLIWSKGLRPKDAIHAATAISETIADLHTFDSDFLKLDGKVGKPALAINEPHTLQGVLPLMLPEEDDQDELTN
jgi:predicted nucleic acid-binding protein